jgi:hypothetical protein
MVRNGQCERDRELAPAPLLTPIKGGSGS